MGKQADTGKEFDAFWAAYPRRIAKGAARRAWARAAAKAGAGEIMRALEAQKAAGLGRDRKYTKHPATWLNGECWLDEAEPANGAPPAPAGEVYGF